MQLRVGGSRLLCLSHRTRRGLEMTRSRGLFLVIERFARGIAFARGVNGFMQPCSYSCFSDYRCDAVPLHVGTQVRGDAREPDLRSLMS